MTDRYQPYIPRPKLPTAKTNKVFVRLTGTELKNIESFAASSNISLSEALRRLIGKLERLEGE